MSKEPKGEAHGHQTDGHGDLWCAVADTNWGKIPGKAKEGNCWFAYGGVEHLTKNFSYVSKAAFTFDYPPQGHQTNEGGGDVWCAVANTQWGMIPGKARDDKCWYSFGGKEHVTKDWTPVKT